MAGEMKGFMKGGMAFNVGEESEGTVEAKGPALPLRILVVADLLPRDEYNAGASAPELSIRVDPTEFDALFARLRPRIAIEVPSVLAEGRNARVDLSPTSLKSFRPDGLVAEVPLLRSLLDGKLMLERLRDGSIDRDKARAELDRIWSGSPFVREVLKLVNEPRSAAPAPAPKAAADDSALASILDMVETDPDKAAALPPPEVPAKPAAVPSRFGDLIAAFALGTGTSSGFSPAQAVARVEKALSAQIAAILQHPEVRRLEEAWRSLQFLVDRAKGAPGLKIDVTCARPELATAAFERAARQGASAEPVSFAVVDVLLDGTPRCFSRLEELSRIAEELTVPVVVNGGPALLGVDQLADIERLDNKQALFTSQLQWQSAAAKPAMRWVAIAANGALGRLGYDKQTSRLREATIVEPGDENAVVWLRPAYLVGALVAQSYKDTRWPCRIVGNRSGGSLENLPVREVKGNIDDAEVVAIPTQAFVSTDSQRELAKAGVLLLASAPNSDAIYLLTAPTAYVPPPKRTYDSATSEEVRHEKVSLGDQLFVARLVQVLRVLSGKLPASTDPAEARKAVESALWTLFEDAKPGSVEIAVGAHGGADGTAVQVAVRPRRFLGVALEELSLEIPLG